ncbi:MAG: peptidylprolyl isomerase, partial [Streptomycetaceae bacterium]|nr:peptidylprolyl isomerase [Streptomycetaceae bacterium]
VVEGQDVVKLIEGKGTRGGTPTAKVVITASGIVD